MRNYSKAIKQRVKAGPNTPGLQLARAAVKHEISIQDIASLLGTARMTVYNWYNGGNVANAYRSRVQELINILKAAPDKDAAWSTACETLKPKSN